MIQANDAVGDNIAGRRFRSTILPQPAFQVNDSGLKSYLKRCQVNDSSQQYNWRQHCRSTILVNNPIWISILVNDSGPRSYLREEPSQRFHDSGQRFSLKQRCRSTIQVNNSVWANISGQRFRSKILFEKVQGQRYRSSILLKTTLQVNDSSQQSYLNQHFRSTNRGQRFYQKPGCRSTILLGTPF